MIYVLGSINIDYGCRLHQLPAAGETVHADSLELSAGGKGSNQALAARRAGAKVAMYGAVGDDAVAHSALAQLRDAGVDLTGVRTSGNKTGCAFVFVDAAGENQIVVLAGANQLVTADQARHLPLTSDDYLLLQLEIPEQTVLAAAAQAESVDATVIASLAPYYPVPASYFQHIDILLLNQHEAGHLSNDLKLSLSGNNHPQSVPRAIANQLNCSVINTLGAAGVCGWDIKTNQGFTVPGTAINAVDTVGAGDTFAGYLGAMLSAGHKLPAACEVASAAAALACTQTGAQTAIPMLEHVTALITR